MLYPRSAWGQREAEGARGRLAGRRRPDRGGKPFTEDTIGESVEGLLDTARAEKDLRRTPVLGLDAGRPEEWPQSLDFLFLVADPNEGRQIKPALNFHFARDPPVFATSYIYDGTLATAPDQDLDGCIS